MRTAAAWLLALGCGAAAAHPHGRLECRVQLGWHADGRLARVEQRLLLDAASSSALADRLKPGAEDAPKPVQQFRSLVLGLFRHAGWMLELRAAGHEAPLALDDRAAAWQQRPDGRLELVLQLVPTAPAPAPVSAAEAWSVACRDPAWYWVAEFPGPEAVQAAGCAVQFEGARDAAAEAATLQAAALRAGVAGAERATLATAGALGAGRAELRCGPP